MNNLFALSVNSKLIGVFTSHLKATQTMWMETLPFGYKMEEYVFDFGIEFYTFRDNEDNEKTYELQEVTPDTRA